MFVRKFQTFSVSAGSKSESLLDIVKNPLHRVARTHDFADIASLQLRPFVTKPLGAELQRDRKQPTEARLKQRRADMHGVICIGI